MKLQIQIVGPKVHDVGYRVFLGKLAMSLALSGLTAYNWEEEGDQEVIVLVEGDPDRMAAFQKQVNERKPDLAEVSSIISEEYDGQVGRISEFATLLTFEQLDKAIPILSSVDKTTSAIFENTKPITKIVSNTEAILENTKPISQIVSNTSAILDDVKGLREDIQPGFASRFQQVQADVKAIKARLGMS
jgi:acylphosphatase